MAPGSAFTPKQYSKGQTADLPFCSETLETRHFSSGGYRWWKRSPLTADRERRHVQSLTIWVEGSEGARRRPLHTCCLALLSFYKVREGPSEWGGGAQEHGYALLLPAFKGEWSLWILRRKHLTFLPFLTIITQLSLAMTKKMMHFRVRMRLLVRPPESPDLLVGKLVDWWEPVIYVEM